jgi:hypothetical protein
MNVLLPLWVAFFNCGHELDVMTASEEIMKLFRECHAVSGFSKLNM